jgi:hypothetical protein
LASFSKSKQFFSKDFQTILWRFSGIPMGYKGKKQKRPTSKYFAAPSSFWTYLRRHEAAFRRPEPRRRRRTAHAAHGPSPGKRGEAFPLDWHFDHHDLQDRMNSVFRKEKTTPRVGS